MASESKSEDVQGTVRPTKGLKEVEEYWWPLMKELQWNRSLHDAHTHLHSSTKASWLMAIPTSSPTSSPAGTIVAFTYANSTGWVGFFIVSAAYRSHGFGRVLFAAALEKFRTAKLQFVGLDGVKEQVGTYARRGFVEAGKIALYVRGGTGNVPRGEGGPGTGERVVDLREVDSEVLVRSDLAHTGLERDRLWSREGVFTREDAFGFAVLGGGDAEDALKGWILVRSCEKGWRVGPVYAQNKAVAVVLLRTAMEKLDGKEGSLIAEVWRGNEDAVGVFEELGWQWAEMDYHRMWLDGKVPPEQSKGGLAEKGMFASFDAAEG